MKEKKIREEKFILKVSFSLEKQLKTLPSEAVSRLSSRSRSLLNVQRQSRQPRVPKDMVKS